MNQATKVTIGLITTFLVIVSLYTALYFPRHKSNNEVSEVKITDTVDNNLPTINNQATSSEDILSSLVMIASSTQKWSDGVSVYGLVRYYGYKCACYDEIGYFNYKDAKEINGSVYVASSSIFSYKTINNNLGYIYGFDNFKYLVSVASPNLYFIDLSNKSSVVAYSLKGEENFEGPDLPSINVKVIDSNTLSVKVYHNRDKEKPWLFEYRTVTIPQGF